MDYKLLVINPLGSQEILNITATGGYFDPTQVLWDERIDGIFPSELLDKLGGLVRVENELVIDEVLLAEAMSKKQAEDELKEQKQIEFAKAAELLDTLDVNKSFSAADIEAALKALIVIRKGI